MHTPGFREGGPVYIGSDDARRGIVVALRVVTQTGHTFSPARSLEARSHSVEIAIPTAEIVS